MICPTCKTKINGAVVDSRQYAKYTRRRRECPVCGTRWTTYEEIDQYSVREREKKSNENQADNT